MTTLLLFIIGCFFGSFLCLLVDRFVRREQVFFGRSRCEHCKHVLAPLDLVPILSYVLNGGKCKYCHAKLPIHLLLSEILCGFVFAITYWYVVAVGLSFLIFLFLLIIFFCFIGIFIADWVYGIIPDEFVMTASIATLPYLYLISPGLILNSFLTGIVTFLFFLALFLGTRGRGMGFGDVKLSFLLGFFLGFPQIIVCLYTAFLTAALFSLILIIIKKKKLHGDTISFGPFLILGAAVAFFFGNQIITLIFG